MKKLFTTCLVAAMAFAMTSCGGQKSESSEADFDILLAEMATVAEQVEAAETQEAKDSLNVLFEVLGQKLSEFEGTISEEQQADLDAMNERFWNAYNKVALPEAAEEAAPAEEAAEAPAEEAAAE